MMDIQFLQLVISALVAIGAGIGVYAAIKSDLTRAILTAENAKDSAKDAKDSAGHAHRRLDDFIRGV